MFVISFMIFLAKPPARLPTPAFPKDLRRMGPAPMEAAASALRELATARRQAECRAQAALRRLAAVVAPAGSRAAPSRPEALRADAVSLLAASDCGQAAIGRSARAPAPRATAKPPSTEAP